MNCKIKVEMFLLEKKLKCFNSRFEDRHWMQNNFFRSILDVYRAHAMKQRRIQNHSMCKPLYVEPKQSCLFLVLAVGERQGVANRKMTKSKASDFACRPTVRTTRSRAMVVDPTVGEYGLRKRPVTTGVDHQLRAIYTKWFCARNDDLMRMLTLLEACVLFRRC
jgi:hypothetical protein